MAIKIYGATSLIGGAPGALDAIDGAILNDTDICIVVLVGSGVYFYILDADSGLSESSPNRIVPNTNPGTKVWLLQPGTFTTVTEV